MNPEKVLELWFGTDTSDPLSNSAVWWKKDPEVDKQIKDTFSDAIDSGMSGQFDAWMDSPKSSLALVILLDQLSRNSFRDTPKSFSQDEMARKVLRKGLDNGFDQQLNPVERWFYYMPMMHSENIEDHDVSIKLFSQLAQSCDDDRLKKTLESALDYAHKHKVIIDQFGRYPHRNSILGRENTPEETKFLTQPGSSF